MKTTESSDTSGATIELPNDYRITHQKVTAKYHEVRLYHGERLLGHYERSNDKELQRKLGEVRRAAKFLHGCVRQGGEFVVKWGKSEVTGKREKRVFVDGKEVGQIPKDMYGDVSWR